MNLLAVFFFSLFTFGIGVIIGDLNAGKKLKNERGMNDESIRNCSQN